jgi:hypothetical protein
MLNKQQAADFLGVSPQSFLKWANLLFLAGNFPNQRLPELGNKLKSCYNSTPGKCHRS